MRTPCTLTFRSTLQGVTYHKGLIYLLTYYARLVLVYDGHTLQFLKSLPYPSRIRQGWGLTSNGVNLILSDGSSTVYILSEDFSIVSTVQIIDNEDSLTSINELEWKGDGIVFANVLGSRCIAIVLLDIGAVVGWIDLSGVVDGEVEAMGRRGMLSTRGNVLNGIAYTNGKLLVTGKKWSQVYQVEQGERMTTKSSSFRHCNTGVVQETLFS
jgi:glutamine cyclotransferase